VVDEAHKFKKELLAFKDDFEKAYDCVDQKLTPTEKSPPPHSKASLPLDV